MSELHKWAWRQYDRVARNPDSTIGLLAAAWQIHLAGIRISEMSMTERTGRIILVPGSHQMDTLTFVRHFNLRHPDSLGGQTRLASDIGFGQEQLYRSFHWRLHDTRIDLDHEHRPDPPHLSIANAIYCLDENGGAHGWWEIAGTTGFISLDDDKIRTRVGASVMEHQTVEDAAKRLAKQLRLVFRSSLLSCNVSAQAARNS